MRLNVSPKTAGLLLALLSALSFGGSGPFARPLMDIGVDPLHVTWLRLLGMVLVLSPVAWHYRSLFQRQWRLLLAYGVFPIAGVQAFYFAAVARIPVGIALLIEFLGPILVLLWILLVRKQPVARSAALGVILAVVGLGALLEVWNGLSLDPIGLLLAAGAAACQAGFFLLSDAAKEDTPPLALIALGGLIAFAVMTVIAQPWNLPWHLLGGQIVIAGVSTSALVSVVWLGVISTALAYVTGVAAIRRLSPPVAGGVAYLEVVTAILLAWIMLGQALNSVQILGAVIVVFGAYLAQRSASHTVTLEIPAHDDHPAVDAETEVLGR
ncbi:EamA family transporter [Salinispirillum sp. LH 10-3-1]|uniref:EamA family transporter n=1 Tax=Salinispirillum sp. LH 10-3-1 TaxID=2952525 RepID=A0AB38YCR8_9GAMM